MFTHLSLKKYFYYMLRGTIILPFIFFFKLDNTLKNYFCIYLLIWMMLFIIDILNITFIESKEIFYKDIKEKKEEFLTITFSLRKTFAILFLYFMISLLFRYKGFKAFETLLSIKFIFFNPIIEGISLSIFASCIFLVIQQINYFKNNFIVYQNLMYSLKGIFCTINNLNILEYLLIDDMHNIALKKCNFIRVDLLNKDLDYLNNSKTFYLSRLDHCSIDSIIQSFSQKNFDNFDNVYISEEILSLLDNMKSLKKHPIKYIIDNY